MCEQCIADTVLIGGEKEVLPGWFLVKAQKDGHSMKAGNYGLVVCNDPSFIFNIEPAVDPLDGMSDEQIEALDKNDVLWELSKVWSQKAYDFTNNIELTYYMMSVYELVSAGIKAGYNEEVDGYNFENWLFNHLGKFIRDNPNV